MPGHRQRESEVVPGHGVPEARVLPGHFHPVAPAPLRGRTPGAPGQGFRGGQSVRGGLLWSGDKLEADPGRAFGDGRQASWTHGVRGC
jgi:hypothetical protein